MILKGFYIWNQKKTSASCAVIWMRSIRKRIANFYERITAIVASTKKLLQKKTSVANFGKEKRR